jgi:subtilisin family serine protease
LHYLIEIQAKINKEYFEMKRVIFNIFLILALMLAFSSTVFAEGNGPKFEKASKSSPQAPYQDGVYIIQMMDDPVIAYEGGKASFASTKPEKGQKINPNSGKVKRYANHLSSQHDQALDKVNGKDAKIYSYVYTFNGFAAKLSAAQVAGLSAQPDVVNVWADEIYQLETDNSPDFLGLNADGGLWDMGLTGEDVIIGVIDTGIWPEHPSFADQVDLADRPGESGKRTKVYGPPPAHWYGSCQSGELFSQDDCNNKLIGARYFLDGFTNNEIKISGDYLSARDADGHGSHTASTAGGNAGVEASIFGIDRGIVSGLAPRARIAAYKACWADSGCAGSDLVMAIDQAVADGVDVINYSIGSSSSRYGPDDLAFLFAADAGVYVATSAGNSGPASSTIGSPAVDPWLTSVGASTQDRTFQGSASSSDGWEFFGASVTASSDELPLVDSEDAGSELCIPGELDPAVVSGKIVLCLRGAIARVEKSHAVYMAGGAGTILYNASDTQTENTDNHWTPAVHINNSDGLVIKAYIDSAGEAAVAKINGGEFTTIAAPAMAAFSSRGPNDGSLDIIKPDVTAPGVNILAANSPTPFLGAPGQLFQSIGGTSMSSPHVAGVFALMKEAYPGWSPAAVKSAIMTTAYQDVMKEDGSTPADPFDYGAGHLNPNPAVNPGLVYDAGFLDYVGFLCGNPGNGISVSDSLCALLESLGIPTDPSDLNYPTIAIGGLPGIQTVQRTVTNVGPAATYHVSYEAPPGIDMVVTPDSLTLAEGESATYSVTFTANESSVAGEWVFGSLTWTHGPHVVRSNIAILPLAIAAPAEVFGTGESGNLDFDVTFGYTGSYTAAPHGLVPATVTSGNVVQDPDQDFDPEDGFSNLHQFTLSGAADFRIAMPPDATEAGADLDIFVFDPDGNFAASSTNGGTDELIDIQLPADGTWDVYVHGWLTPGGDSDYNMWTWEVPLASGGSLNVDSAPASATTGVSGTIDISWSGLTSGSITDWYLGAVSHSDSGGLLDLTLVNVNNR